MLFLSNLSRLLKLFHDFLVVWLQLECLPEAYARLQMVIEALICLSLPNQCLDVLRIYTLGNLAVVNGLFVLFGGKVGCCSITVKYILQ